MRAGVFLAYWPWFTPAEQVELAVLADRLGLDSAWVAEAWGQDAVSVLGMLAGKTDRIGLGSGLMQIPARRATATAMAAVSLDVLSEGRFRLGLGLERAAGQRGLVRRAVHAQPGPHARVRRRRAPDAGAREDPDGHGGRRARPRARQAAQAAGAAGAGAAADLPRRRSARRPSRQTGAIADGWLPFMLDPTEPELLLGPLREGAESAGRSLADIDIAPVVPLAIDENLDAARDAVRPWLAFYLGSMGAKSKNFYVELAERQGHGAAAREVQEKGLAGDRLGAVAAVTDGLVDAGAIATTPAGLDERLAIYERAGVTTLVAVPCGDDKPGVLRALAAATVTQMSTQPLLIDAPPRGHRRLVAGRPVPGRRLRREAARGAAQARAGPALRRGLELPPVQGQGLLRAARRRRRGPVRDVAQRLRAARLRAGRLRRRLPGRRRRRPGLLPRLADLVAVVLLRRHRPADRRRGRPARPDGGAAPRARRRRPLRAPEGAGAPGAAALHRRRHRRGRQGARRRPGRAAPPRLGRPPGLGVRAGPGSPRRAVASPARCRISRRSRRSRS